MWTGFEIKHSQQTAEKSHRWRAWCTLRLKQKKKERNWPEFNLCQKVFQFGLQFQLDSPTILISASIMKAIKLIAIALMNFDNLMNSDLMTGIYIIIPYILILLFWLWPYLLNYVFHCLEEFKIHSVEKVSEVSQKSKVETVANVKRRTSSKGKAK